MFLIKYCPNVTVPFFIDTVSSLLSRHVKEEQIVRFVKISEQLKTKQYRITHLGVGKTKVATGTC